MKKGFVLFFIFSFVSIFSKEVIVSQKELIKMYEKELKKSSVYEKFNPIYAREAVIGEQIKTITKDGLETINTAYEGDYIVKNQTLAKEEYIVPKEKFEKRYTFIKNLDKNWNIYKPTGEIKAIKVETKETFYIMAPWNEKMIVKSGDFLVSPLDYSEVYRIANHEFFETYKLKK
ncbi:hypothetical protein H3N56_11905 [Cetobacterium sp. 2A]|uniref:hypothetical protein n=1 Tax=unclassified Cetobacterium TaxID=2630983 RepID=UPI00163C6017|nr:hypothetical protein [Cetobacterium sp. 2A]MBC2857138.1 hypothetical protein [Cetobacterium sp. 2A]